MKLIHTETGHVVPWLSEPLSRFRRARKVLDVPMMAEGESILYALVWRVPGSNEPLNIAINDKRFVYQPTSSRTFLHWARINVPAGVLRHGDNEIVLWTDTSIPAWFLALEGNHPMPGSFVSFDGGMNWQNERMGLYHTLSGEYVVRLFLAASAEDTVSPPPAFVWEQRHHERLEVLREVVPEPIRSLEDHWQFVRALASWVSQSWVYKNASGYYLYAPWDVPTILGWEGNTLIPGYVGEAIRMCVHYSVVFVQLCLACGVPARCIVTTGGEEGAGHFVSEVWHPDFQQWCMVDPNLDMVFMKNGRPLAANEIYEHRIELLNLAEYGPGWEFQHERLGEFLREEVLTGRCYRQVGLWNRNDFITRPDLTPPGHGAQAYSETEIVWRDKHIQNDELSMFPFFCNDSYWQTPPPDEWQQS